MTIPEELSQKHNAKDLQDLNARTSWGRFQQHLHRIFTQGPVWHHARTPRGRISLGPLQELRTRTCTKSCKGLWQHVTKISTRSSHKDVQRTLTKIFMPGPLYHKIVLKRPAAGEELDTRTSQEHPYRIDSIQARLRNGICKIFRHWTPRGDLTRISTRSSDKDLNSRIMQGPVREEIIRISTRSSCKDLS